MTRSDESTVELFLVDCGIDNLNNVYLDLPRLEVLNLHSNYIAKIVNLERLRQLRVLDLSSNHLTKMEGLEHLKCLQHLNVACNEIAVLEGISKLMSLLTLNLSYNKVCDLSGLAALRGAQCQLQVVELQGNKLFDIEHIIDSARCCRMLRYLILEDPTVGNPVCRVVGYQSVIKSRVTSIVSVHKRDLPEQLIFAAATGGSDPGTISHTDQEPAKTNIDVRTPHIDFVLQQRQAAAAGSSVPARGATRADSSSAPSSMSDGCVTRGDDGAGNARERALRAKLHDLEKELLAGRLDRLERQLALLTHQPEADQSDSTPREEGSSNNEHESSTEQPDSGRTDLPQVKTTALKNAGDRNNGIKVKGIVRRAAQTSKPSGKQAASDSAAIAAGREAINATYSQFLDDLAKERERRWKAEEAAKKLAEEVTLMRGKCSELEQKEHSYDEAMRSLQKSGASELQLRKAAEDALVKLRGDLQTTEGRCKDAVRTADEERRMRHAAEETLVKLERHNHELQLQHAEERQAMDKSLIANREEINALQRSCTALKKDLDDMRSLFAAREQEHRYEIEQRYLLDSPKLEELFEAKVTSLVKKHAQEVQQMEERLAIQLADYGALEDEFRLALQVEAERFNTLQDAYEQISAENAQHRQQLLSSNAKDVRTTKIIAEMTSLIKEQKDKIVKLSASRQEQASAQKGAQAKLESQVTALRKQVFDADRLRKEAADLKMQIQGQHSIIVGLRTERELWSKELAQQGASLSADRGKLESHIETLVAENGTLKTQLQQELDTVKIKAKVIQDQTETIAALKQRLSEKDHALQVAERELESKAAESEAAASAERARSAEMEEINIQLQSREDELQQRLGKALAELEEAKRTYRALKDKWKEKSAAIAELEGQVQRAKQTWEDSNRQLAEERNKAVVAADLALKKLHAADNNFRAQLESKEAGHADAMRALEQQHKLQLAEAESRVEQVEAEMRDMLSGEALARQQTEAKLKLAADAFAQLQKELLH